MNQKDTSKPVNHWCPVAGKQIQIETTTTKTCPECKFAVHKLIFVMPFYVQFVFLAHIVSIAYFIIYILTKDSSMLYIAIIIFSFDLTYYIFAKYSISKKRYETLEAKLLEFKNWSIRNQ